MLGHHRSGWLLMFLALQAPLLAQNHTPKQFLAHLLEDQQQIWAFPVQKESWKSLQTYLLMGVSGLSFPLDGDFSRDLRTRPGLEGFNRFFASRSSDLVFAALPALVLAGGLVARDAPLTDYGWKSAEALTTATLASLLLKAATQRSRPHTGKEFAFWEGGNSFPSAHSAGAWALAAVTARHFEEHRWVPWVVYPLAGALSFSRISSGNHFTSDVVVGSLLGFSIGYFVIH